MALDDLRPKTLAEFGGQPDITRDLGILLGAAKAREEMPDHVLLAGPPGLGKTTLAAVIAREMSVPLVTTSGPVIEKPGDIASLLTGLRERSILFIDEIHALERKAEELLYAAMEDGVVDVVIGEGAKTRTIRLPIVDFTLVGATTQSGLLSAPLRDRFGYIGRLRLYEDADLARIVHRSAHLLGIEIDDEGANVLASRSRGTPRVANRWLRRVRDWVQVNNRGLVDAYLAKEALASYGVDELGLDHLGREILEALITRFNGGPVGLGALSSSIGETPSTIEQVYEPYLLRKGLLVRTPRGRMATEKAYAHIGKRMPKDRQLLAVDLGYQQETLLTDLKDEDD